MRSKHWLGLTLILFLALVAAILLLLPWSPLSITSLQDKGHESATAEPTWTPESSQGQGAPSLEDLIKATEDENWKVPAKKSEGEN